MLKNKNVWILMAGEFTAGLGMWVGIIGNLEFLQKLVPSDFHKSLILLAGLLVGVLAGPMAGKIIDRSSKKEILIYSGLVRVFSMFFMFIAIWTESIAWMIAYMVGIGLAAAFYFPAIQAVIPMIARGGELLTLNGVHMNVGTIARIIGTALAGILLVYISLFNLYLLTLVSYIIILICTFALDIQEDAVHEKTDKSVSKNTGGFKEIIPLLKKSPQVVLALFLLLVPTLFIGSFNLMVLEISELQQDPSVKSWLYTAEGLAFMLGAFLIKKVTGEKNPVKIMLLCAVIISFSHLSLFFADSKILSILSFAVFGFFAGVFFPVAATLFQTAVAKEYHGRFFSFRGMVDRILFQLILVGTGFFLDTIGFKNMVLCFGGMSLILVIFFFLRQTKPREKVQLKSAS
ncbi:MFS transporter [Peribacillus sp. SCS-155]|uniref:MFS transporter n=1 Tax=Peribacillus sedimenti TaxID=3115297 RepID=UPI0039057C58